MQIKSRRADKFKYLGKWWKT